MGIPEHLGGGEGSVPRLALQKVQLVCALQLHKHFFHVTSAHLGRLQWVIGLDGF